MGIETFQVYVVCIFIFHSPLNKCSQMKQVVTVTLYNYKNKKLLIYFHSSVCVWRMLCISLELHNKSPTNGCRSFNWNIIPLNLSRSAAAVQVYVVLLSATRWSSACIPPQACFRGVTQQQFCWVCHYCIHEHKTIHRPVVWMRMCAETLKHTEMHKSNCCVSQV